MPQDPLEQSTSTQESPWRDRRHKALVVGIDRYACPKFHDLGGCRNDASLLGDVLAEAFDFGVARLLDEGATRAAIIDHLSALLDSCQEDDEIVFCFSGHGSRILSREYGAFETLVPHDSFRPDDQGRRAKPNRDVTDRELYGWILKVSDRGARVTLLIDACRSGGIVRDLEIRPRGVEPDLRRGALEDKVAFLATREASEHRAVESTYRQIATSGWLPPSDRYTLLAACQADEFCREMVAPDTQRRHGILSLFVASELPFLREPTSWRDLHDRIARRISAENPGQHIQLEGALDREIFGGAWLRPSPFARVLVADSEGVELSLGAAHGVGVGSEWQIFSAGARSPQGPPLASTRVEDVGAIRARARFEGDPEARQEPNRAGDDLVDCRAFETARHFGPKLRVLVAEPHRALLRALDDSMVLERVHEPCAADLVIHQLGPRRAKAPLEPAPNLFPLDSPHWVIVDRGGAQAMPKRPVPASSLASHRIERRTQGTVEDLERLARHRFLQALAHPEPEYSLARHVDVQMLRKRRNGPWSRIDRGGIVSLGNQIAVRLERKSGAPERLYVAALDLGLTGAVTVLYPRRAQRVPWKKERLEIGFRADDAMHVKLPRGLPFAGEAPFRRARETLLVFLSTQWTDFDGLAQEAVSALRSRASSPLSTILDRGLGCSLRSKGGENLLTGSVQWGLVACPFEVVA